MSGVDPTRRGMVTQMASSHGRVTPSHPNSVTEREITGVSSIDERAATPTLIRLRDAAQRLALAEADLVAERYRANVEGHSWREIAEAVREGRQWPGVPG